MGEVKPSSPDCVGKGGLQKPLDCSCKSMTARGQEDAQPQKPFVQRTLLMETAQALWQQRAGGTTVGWLGKPQYCGVWVKAPEIHTSDHYTHFALQPLHRWFILPGIFTVHPASIPPPAKRPYIFSPS